MTMIVVTVGAITAAMTATTIAGAAMLMGIAKTSITIATTGNARIERTTRV
jgi:hypothetical protein